MLPVILSSAAVASAALVFYLQRHVKKRSEPWVAAVRHLLDKPCLRQVDLPVEIMPHLLLGDKRCANDLATIEAFGVTHILNCAGRYAHTEHASTRKGYLQISADDEEGYPILKRHLEEARAFIKRARDEGGRCLIHCQAGINRSGCLAVADLMLTEQLPVMEAVARAKNARGILLSNHSFQAQLVQLARQHGLLGPRPADVPLGVGPMKQPRRSAADALRNLG